MSPHITRPWHFEHEHRTYEICRPPSRLIRGVRFSSTERHSTESSASAAVLEATGEPVEVVMPALSLSLDAELRESRFREWADRAGEDDTDREALARTGAAWVARAVAVMRAGFAGERVAEALRR